MLCSNCHKAEVPIERVALPYTSNLPNVIADGLERGLCPLCGEGFTGFPRMRELSHLVLSSVIGKPWRLAPEEVRWIRMSMGMKGEALADTLGVTPSQLSRWENAAAPTSALADRLLRMLAASFHQVPAPDLRVIDGTHAEPIVMRLELKRSGWRIAESTAANPPSRKRKSKAA